jgi:hypothetical protein
MLASKTLVRISLSDSSLETWSPDMRALSVMAPKPISQRVLALWEPLRAVIPHARKKIATPRASPYLSQVSVKDWRK